jgi:hypothetical protein
LLEGGIYNAVSNSGQDCGSWRCQHALAGLLQLFLSFLVSEVSVESVVGFFPRRKRAMVEERTGSEPEWGVGKREGDGTVEISRICKRRPWGRHTTLALV